MRLNRMLPVLGFLLPCIGWGAVHDGIAGIHWPAEECTGATISGWSSAGASASSAELDEVAMPGDGALALPVGGDATFRRMRIECTRAGTLIVSMDCPRPIQCWIGGQRVMDEKLNWRDPQRIVQAVLIVPAKAGSMQLTIQVGPRSRHPQSINADCPSRNRAAVLERIAAELPDLLSVSIAVASDPVPACSLRYSPVQFRQGGIAYQQIIMTMIGDVTAAVRPAVATDAGEGVEIGQGAGPSHGIHQLFVPLVHGDFPPLRQAGDPEPRAEPASRIARILPLSIAGPAGRLITTMPAFEGHGRNAPQREFRQLTWPSVEDLLAAAPEPVLPDQYVGFLRLYRKSWELVHDLVRASMPETGLPNGYVGTARKGFMNMVFMWDSCFTAMGYCYAWRAMPYTATVDLLYSFQQDGGYISRETDVHTGMPLLYEPDFSPNPPMPAVTELSFARLTGDIERLRKVYPVLVDFHRWLQVNRRLPDGTFWTTGLANGLDNSPSLGDGYPDLTAQMAHAADCLSTIAEAIGKSDDAEMWKRDCAATAKACNDVLWSEPDHFYLTSLAGGGHNPNKVVTGFWPLWAGIVPADRIAALARQVKDTATFWRVHPVPSLSADSPQYKSAGNYWLGSTWAPTYTAVIKGFQRSGRLDIARELTIRHLQAMLTVFDATGKLWENYCPDKEERGNRSTQDYSWTISGPIRLLIETLIGIEPDALHRRIRWTPIPHVTIGIKRLSFADATISLVQTANGDRDSVAVATDRPFTLELYTASHLNSHDSLRGNQKEWSEPMECASFSQKMRIYL